jgi:hypothetical protein
MKEIIFVSGTTEAVNPWRQFRPVFHAGDEILGLRARAPLQHRTPAAVPAQAPCQGDSHQRCRRID